MSEDLMAKALNFANIWGQILQNAATEEITVAEAFLRFCDGSLQTAEETSFWVAEDVPHLDDGLRKILADYRKTKEMAPPNPDDHIIDVVIELLENYKDIKILDKSG